MKHLRSFTITYLPQTNYKSARVRIYDNRFKVTKIVSYHDSPSDRVEDIALAYLEKIGIHCSILSQARKGQLLLTDNFETQIK
jgi:hypothetical protein